MPYDWQEFTDTLDGTRPVRKEERDELWDALADLLERCGGRWRLKSSDMALIKSRLSITDLTSLEDPDDTDTTEVGDLAKVLIAIQDTFSGTTGYAAFQHVAPDEGLSTAQLAEFITAGGRATQVDAFHLWNLYKRVLDYLSCCPTSVPVFQWDSVSASKTKVGFEDWPSLVVSPPRIFLTQAINGFTAGMFNWDSDGCRDPVETSRYTYYGSNFYDYDGVLHHNAFVDVQQRNCYCAGDPRSESCTDWVYAPGLQASPDISSDEMTYSSTATSSIKTVTSTPPAAGYYGEYQTDDVTVTRTDLYATTQLITNTQAALPAFDDDYDDTAGSYRNLSADELTYNERRTKPRLSLAGLHLVAGQQYRAVYFRRFIPLNGDPNVDGDEEQVEFTYEADMEYVYPDLAVPVADTNGTNTLVPVRWECAPFDDDEEGGE